MDEWRTEPDLSSITHTLRTLSGFLAMAADDAEKVDPRLDEVELNALAAAADAVVRAVGEVVNLQTNYPALRVLERRS